MHPRQLRLLDQAQTLLDRTASVDVTAAPTLWKYTCPDSGTDFYLPKKMVSVKSPFTGKSFSAKPEKFTMTDVGKELKDDAKADKKSKAKTAAELGLDPEVVASEFVMDLGHPAVAVLASSLDKVRQAHAAAHGQVAASGGKVAASDNVKPVIAAVEELAKQAGLVAEQLTARTQV